MKSSKREMEKKSEISCVIEELSMVVIVKPSEENHEAAHIPTKPFLSLCYFVLQVLGRFFLLQILNVYVQSLMWFLTFYIDTLEMMCVITDKIGPTMAVLRQDVYQNIKVWKIYKHS